MTDTWTPQRGRVAISSGMADDARNTCAVFVIGLNDFDSRHSLPTAHVVFEGDSTMERIRSSHLREPDEECWDASWENRMRRIYAPTETLNLCQICGDTIDSGDAGTHTHDRGEYCGDCCPQCDTADHSDLIDRLRGVRVQNVAVVPSESGLFSVLVQFDATEAATALLSADGHTFFGEDVAAFKAAL